MIKIKNSNFSKLLRLSAISDIKKTFCNVCLFCKNKACVNCGTFNAATQYLVTPRVGSKFSHIQICYTKKENKSTLLQIAIFRILYVIYYQIFFAHCALASLLLKIFQCNRGQVFSPHIRALHISNDRCTLLHCIYGRYFYNIKGNTYHKSFTVMF